MDITVYLPDEIGRWAKEHDVNLSAMLREAVIEERQRREVVDIGGESEVHELYTEDDIGGHTVRLHGKEIAYDGRHVTAYLTEDGGVFVYHGDEQQLYELGDPADPNPDPGYGKGLRPWFDDDATYVGAMAAIGEKAIIDVGQA